MSKRPTEHEPTRRSALKAALMIPFAAAFSPLEAHAQLLVERSPLEKLRINPLDTQALNDLGLMRRLPPSLQEQALVTPQAHPSFKDTWSITYDLEPGVYKWRSSLGHFEHKFTTRIQEAIIHLGANNFLIEEGQTNTSRTDMAIRLAQGDRAGIDWTFTPDPELPEEHKGLYTKSVPNRLDILVKYFDATQDRETNTDSIRRTEFNPSLPTILVLRSISGSRNLAEEWEFHNGQRSVNNVPSNDLSNAG